MSWAPTSPPLITASDLVVGNGSFGEFAVLTAFELQRRHKILLVTRTTSDSLKMFLKMLRQP